MLLSKSEYQYLAENKKFSKSFEYKIKSQVKKKITIFLEHDFPLLFQSGLINVNDLILYINSINNLLLNLGKIEIKY
jgi:hypothetical protein